VKISGPRTVRAKIENRLLRALRTSEFLLSLVGQITCNIPSSRKSVERKRTWWGGWPAAGRSDGCFSALHTALVSPMDPHPSHRSLRARCASLPAARCARRGREKRPHHFVPDSSLKQPRHTFAPRGALRRSYARNLSPFETRGRGECRVPNAPAAWCAHIGSEYARQYSQRRHRKHPAFPTRWF